MVAYEFLGNQIFDHLVSLVLQQWLNHIEVYIYFPIFLLYLYIFLLIEHNSTSMQCISNQFQVQIFIVLLKFEAYLLS